MDESARDHLAGLLARATREELEAFEAAVGQHGATPPAAGEVGELVSALGSTADGLESQAFTQTAALITRAATLIQQLALRHPAPVPVPKGLTRDDLWELWLRLNNELPDRPAAVAEFWEHAQIDARARAADLLEQRHPAPVPVVYAPTDEELLELADDSDMDRLEGERGYPDGTVIKEGCWEAWDHQLLAFARAVLAKYGTTPVPTPVPVSDRLPDASDPGECRMPDGDCWWFDPHADGAWYFDTYQGNYTHWLPAHALPLPAGEVSDDR